MDTELIKRCTKCKQLKEYKSMASASKSCVACGTYADSSITESLPILFVHFLNCHRGQQLVRKFTTSKEQIEVVYQVDLATPFV